MNFAIVNLGCKVNRVESDGVAAQLIDSGWFAAPEASADLIVVNTCTVTGEAEKKTRKAVRRALRENERAVVIVTGCAAAIDAATYEAMSPRVRIVGKVQLADEVGKTVRELSAGDACSAPSAALDACACGARETPPGWSADSGSGSSPLPHDGSPLPCAESASVLAAGRSDAGAPSSFPFRTRVGVKVQDGCNNACTFCIVHVARGRAVSRPADAIVRECVDLVRAGVHEIVLTGINLGSYCDGGRRDADAALLPDLLERLLVETAGLHGDGERACRFRISSIEPRDVSEGLIDLMARSDGRICRHLHLPLQSGSTKVLREMARPYTAEQFGALVEHLYEALPSLSLSTDVICGFPGETDGEFEETLAMARICRFSKIHVFPYSMRSGTPAAARADQIAPDVRTARAARLRRLGDELREADLARRAGTCELALVEESGVAMTESYHELPAPPDASPGSLVLVSL